MGAWLGRRWHAGRLSFVVGIILGLFALGLLLAPQNGCGPSIVEAFRNNYGSQEISERTIASYDCRSIARSALPVGAVIALLATWFIVAPSRRERVQS